MSHSPCITRLLMVLGILIGSRNVRSEDVHKITIDGGQTFQTIEGFGTCLVSWGKFPDIYKSDGFARFYHDTVGLNILREELNDFFHPEVQNAQDISWERIEVKSRAAHFVEFAKRLKRLDPEVKIIGTVWTPPPWMKINGQNGSGRPRGKNSAIGAQDYKQDGRNRVAPEKYEHFVQWLVAVAQFHKKQGIPFHGLSLANEPRFSQWYGSCVWTGEDYATVLGMLGEALEKAGLGEILLFGPEDMTGHMTVVLINSTARPRSVALDFRNIGLLKPMTMYRTKADEGFKSIGALQPSGQTATVNLPGHSVVSLVRQGSR